jgi:diguanylate cyclase (GGDEF)-like protein
MFAVLTALGVAVAAAVILAVVRDADVAQAHAYAVDRARFAARAVLGPELRSSDLSAPTAKRERELGHLFRTRVLIAGVRAATLYGPNGRPIYSSSGTVVSRDSYAHVQAAMSGTTVSQITRSEDGTRVLRAYLPVNVAGRGGGGVVQLDQEYEAVVAAAKRSSWLIAGVLEGLLILLFLAFVPLLARTSSRIRSHVEDLEYAAVHDELTGLPNRHGFRRAAEAALIPGGSAALLLVDLDGFSEVNRSLGDAHGDRLLTRAGERIARVLDPESELVARLGEDEFGVLLDGGDREDAEHIAELIRECFERSFVVDGICVALSVDIGVAMFPEHGTDPDAVLASASAALLTAKANDRTRVEVYRRALGASDRSQLELVAELRDAMSEDRFLVHYQPQADFLTHEIRGVEALVRWNHPVRGLLTAGEFISQAERSGIGQELRSFVVETAARQLSMWRAQGLDLDLAINVSAVDLLDPTLPSEIEEAIASNGLPPWSIVLEVTESTLIGDVRRASAVADRLANIGVRLSIDDFGTGYTSLASLRTFQIQQVKLDRSLLADVPGDERAEAIVGGCVEIAHGLGALVVAEGIETREQWRFAYTVGCDLAQGYLVGKPATAAGLLALLDVPRLMPLRVA